MEKSISIVLLAAGKGTRLKVAIPKPLLPCLNRPLVSYVVDMGLEFFAKHEKISRKNMSVITGHEREQVEAYLRDFYGDQVNFVEQSEQLGTGHALQCYLQQFTESVNYEYTMVLCADTPLLSFDILEKMYDVVVSGNLDGAVATFDVENPTGYGRIVRDKQGFYIVEEKDAADQIKAIKEVNSGVYIFKTEYLNRYITELKNNNNSQELYLTDLFKSDRAVEAISFSESELFLGVNDFSQLEIAEKYLIKRYVKYFQRNGVHFRNSDTVWLNSSVQIAPGCVIGAGVYLENATLGEGVIVENGAIIKNSVIDSGVTIKAYSYLDNARVHQGAAVGPFAHLRPHAEIGEGAKIGNFVEIKKSKLDRGVKVSHLSYVGDAEIGAHTNIGCGFITCNYDGANKHKTVIGKNSFIGSDSQMIAPVELGDECYVASGSTITHSMPSGAFAIARGRQVTKEGMARRFIKKKK